MLDSLTMVRYCGEKAHNTNRTRIANLGIYQEMSEAHYAGQPYPNLLKTQCASTNTCR